MSGLFYGANHHSAPQHSGSHAAHPNGHHGPNGRSRRAPRLPGAHNHKQFRAVRSPKNVVDVASMTTFRRDFEAARSFDIEDDELFCPFHLLTEDDLQSIHSSGSDRSSLSSGSPDSSPLQQQLQPTPAFLLPTSATFNPSTYQHHNSSQNKIHQPLAQRTRNAIPIVDPSTRTVTSPPPSVSPGRQMTQQFNMGRRW